MSGLGGLPIATTHRLKLVDAVQPEDSHEDAGPRRWMPLNWDPREQADVEHAAAINFATLLIVGVICFAAGALTLATLAFVLVHW